jgi:hypothetical protein
LRRKGIRALAPEFLNARNVEDPQEHGVETLRSSLIEALTQVPLGVQRDLYRRVTEAELDDLWVLSFGDEHGRMGVSEVMKPHWLTNRRPT